MKLELKQIGGSMSRPSFIIELVVECNNGYIYETITKLDGSVDVELIHSLRQIADRLEEQNDLVKESLG